MNYLTMEVKSALMSFGELGQGLYRKTALTPTKSAVVGMLSAALGYPRGDARILELQRAITFSWRRVELDTKILTDFQTMQGLDMSSKTQKSMFAEAVAGTLSSRRHIRAQGYLGDSFITHRQYMQNVTMVFFISAEVSLLETLKAALENPRYALYGGRKCCLLAKPMVPTLGTDLKEALFAPPENGKAVRVGWEDEALAPERAYEALQFTRRDLMDGDLDARLYVHRTENQLELSS